MILRRVSLLWRICSGSRAASVENARCPRCHSSAGLLLAAVSMVVPPEEGLETTSVNFSNKSPAAGAFLVRLWRILEAPSCLQRPDAMRILRSYAAGK